MPDSARTARDAVDAWIARTLVEAPAEMPAATRAKLARLMAQAQSITCPRCGLTSYHPDDVREGYCGNCHEWTTQNIGDR